jgi:TonB-linked SusC/RagA family outer membrane protein
MKKLLLVSLCFLVLCVTQVFAQNRTVTGTVTAKDDGLPIPGVTVKIKGTDIGTPTDVNGKYSISAPTGSTIVFSFISFSSQEVLVGSQSVINISLASSSRDLNEVVVVGYGTGTKLSNVVGNISVVDKRDFSDKPVANVFDALQGKVAGLQIFTSSGEPSATPSITLHGVGSLGGVSSPLIVMDGTPVDLSTILSFNPDDFESISVLKDASATSIYGSRAANGVIMLTTKKGSANRPTVTVTGQYSINQLASNKYFESFMNRQQFIDFSNTVNANGSFSEPNPQTTIFGDGTAGNPGLAVQNADTKWYKVYYKNTSPTYNTNIAISGGSDKTTYYISGGFFKSDGLTYRSGYDRYTLRSNVNSAVTKWLSVGLNLSLAYDDRLTNPYGTNSTNRGLALLALPYYSPKDPSGNNYQFIPGWGRYHPEYLANENPDPNNKTAITPIGYLQLTPVKGLTIKSQAGIDAYDYRETLQRLPSYLGALNQGTVGEYFTRYVNKTFTNTAEYKFDVASDHHFTVLGGQESIDGSISQFNTNSIGFADDRLLTLNNGSKSGVTNNQYKSEYSYKSLFGRVDYSYLDKYLVEGSIRQDKSSRFGINKQQAVFWSGGATWKAKKENFLSGVSWIDDLDVKFSTGTTGNSLLDNNPLANNNYLPLPTVSNLNYNGVSGYQLGTAGNNDLSWETQHLTTFGINASLFNTLRIEASYYIRKTTDMLITVPYAYTSGFSSNVYNTGALQNVGFDLHIEADVYRDSKHKAYITPYITGNINHDKVTALFQGKTSYILANTGVAWTIGQPVNYVYPIWAGVNSASGLPQWYLPGTDIYTTRKDASAVTSTFSAAGLQQSTGIKRNPWSQGGFGLSAGYEGISLQADFSYVLGKYLINNDRYFFENPNQFPGFNQTTRILDYWKAPGDNTLFPKLGQQFTQFDSRLIENASFMRLKNLTIGYSFPKSVLQHIGAVKGAKVFVTGRNLMTVTKYLGPDPEVDSNLSLGQNPNTKQYSFGFQLTF